MSGLIGCLLAVRSTLRVGPATASALAAGAVRPTTPAPSSGTAATSASVQTRRITHPCAQIEGHRRLWILPEMVNNDADTGPVVTVSRRRGSGADDARRCNVPAPQPSRSY